MMLRVNEAAGPVSAASKLLWSNGLTEFMSRLLCLRTNLAFLQVPQRFLYHLVIFSSNLPRSPPLIESPWYQFAQCMTRRDVGIRASLGHVVCEHAGENT